MKVVSVAVEDLVLLPELSRTRGSKPFEDRLRASIEEIGLAEPIKVARVASGKYLVVDGTMRVKAISQIRASAPDRFESLPAYVVDYNQRFELRYQTDIYQDLLPSQLASLVEHLHQFEHVKKIDIARYIGVSPPTLRNYTGLWRLLQRGGLFARLVDLMDVGVLPASNPYAWLRLNSRGITYVLEERFGDRKSATQWIDEMISLAQSGNSTRYPLKHVESATNGLPAFCYRESADVRSQKRDLGLRRAAPSKRTPSANVASALQHLGRVSRKSPEPVVRSAARSLAAYLR